MELLLDISSLWAWWTVEGGESYESGETLLVIVHVPSPIPVSAATQFSLSQSLSFSPVPGALLGSGPVAVTNWGTAHGH